MSGPTPAGGERRALVLGGGGVAGIAWMTGLLAGLSDTGRDVTDVELLIGTSAGSTVAAQLGRDLSLEQLYARQTERDLQTAELDPAVDMTVFAVEILEVMKTTGSHADIRRAVGQFALDARTVTEADRRAVIAARLPSHEWPVRDLRIVAVDCGTGEPRVFDRLSGVNLVDAVTASCAVPGIWPPATIEGRRYMDGGIRSSDNADYAAGATRALILSPLGTQGLFPSEVPLGQAVQALRDSGAEVAVVTPDEASTAAVGANPLDPSTRRPAAEAGRAQGRTSSIEWTR